MTHIQSYFNRFYTLNVLCACNCVAQSKSKFPFMLLTIENTEVRDSSSFLPT